MPIITVGELRKDAQAALDHVSLSDIYLADGKWSCSDPASLGSDLTVDSAVQVRGELADSELRVWVRYRVTATASGIAEAAREAWEAFGDIELPDVAWNSDSEWVASYAYDGDASTLDSRQVHSFALVMGPPTVHPYARHLVQDWTSKSWFPAFTLDLLSPISGLPDDASVQVASLGDVTL